MEEWFPNKHFYCLLIVNIIVSFQIIFFSFCCFIWLKLLENVNNKQFCLPRDLNGNAFPVYAFSCCSEINLFLNQIKEVTFLKFT